MYRTIFDDLFDVSQQMNRIFNDAGWNERRNWPESNIYENQDEYILVAKVPGMESNDLDLTLKDNSLTISGERKKDTDSNASLHLEERFNGKFERRFMLNERIDSSKIEAETSNGLLIVKLPKSAESKPRKITIK